MRTHLTFITLLALPFVLLVGVASATEFTTIYEDFALEDHALMIPLEEGVRRVRLQRYDQEYDTWETKRTVHLQGAGGQLKLRLPDGVPFEDLRISKSLTDPFPYEFYTGRTSFQQEGTTDSFFDRFAVPDATGGDGGDGGVVVEESDIWQWRGDVLYFFNQNRGLQVFDLSTPASPQRLATLRMPAVGEEMYLVGDTHVALLANQWAAQSSEIIFVRHTGSTLEEVKRFSVDGTFVESRMVGNWLYAVSRRSSYQSTANGESWWRTGLLVHAFDLTDPDNATAKAPLELTDEQSKSSWWYNAVVTATPNELLIAPWDYDWRSGRGAASTIHVIDIRDPSQPLAISRKFALEGRVLDKFKLRVKDGILTTVAHVANSEPREVYTCVETYDLRAPADRELAAPRLDFLRMATNESLFATRFDQDRLYVVTFRRIDPLFVVDLSAPNNLRVLGELEVPGFSTYLQPMGDRLLSVGVEDRKVAISLFDVSDTANLSLLKRVTLGEEFSWSDANFDEKAVGYLPDQSLLLVPYQSYEEDTWVQRYQLLDISQDDLVMRGVIEHAFHPRRATTLGDHLVSISGFELLVSNASNRDAPTFVASYSMAWPVDRLLKMGDHLLQLDQGDYGYGSGADDAYLRVSLLNSPDTLLSEMAIGGRGIVGAELHGEHLFIAQVDYRQLLMSEEPDIPEFHNLLLTKIINLSDPLEPFVEGVLEIDLGERSYGFPELRAEFLSDDHLVWLPSGQSTYWWRGPWLFEDVAVGGVARDVAIGWPIFFLPGRADLVVINFQNKANPQLASHTVLEPEHAREFGPAVSRNDGQVMISYSRFEATDEASGVIENFLQVIDFADPAVPIVSAPVNIPGKLEHVYDTADDGTLIFTSLGETVNEGDEWRNDSIVHVSVFDGETAYLIDEVSFPNAQWTPLAFSETYFFKASGWNSKPLGVQVYGWMNSGMLERIALLPTGDQAPSQFVIADDILMATHGQGVEVIDIRDPGAEMPLQHYELPFYLSLNHAIVDRHQPTPTVWLPVGLYGVETLDLQWLTETPLVLAQEEGEESDWVNRPLDPRNIVRASGDDYVGKLGSQAAWEFRAGNQLTGYIDWASEYVDAGEIPDSGIDSDGDGFTNWMEYALGTDPTDRIDAGNLTIETVDVEAGANDTVRWVRVTYPVNRFAPDVAVTIMQSSDLHSWVSTTDTIPKIWIRLLPDINKIILEWPSRTDDHSEMYRLSIESSTAAMFVASDTE